MDHWIAAVNLRVLIGESDHSHHHALHEEIVRQARKYGLEGATVYRSILGYGHGRHIRTDKILDLSSDLTVIIEIIDEDAKIKGFLPVLDELMTTAHSGGLVVLQPVEVRRYFHHSS